MNPFNRLNKLIIMIFFDRIPLIILDPFIALSDRLGLIDHDRLDLLDDQFYGEI